MSQASNVTRSATADEMPRAIATIVAAFIADPPARFAWPSAHDYLQAMPLATRAFAGSCFAHGTAYVSADFRGGVDPAAQGAGIGAALMRHALARCDEDQLPAYLEASKPSNIPFCQRHGFEVTGQNQVGAAPPVTPMVRKPRRQESL